MQKVFEYEASGYPTTPDGVPPEIYRLAVIGNREFRQKDEKTKQVKSYVYLEATGELEDAVKLADTALEAAKDASTSMSSSNPRQYLHLPAGNWYERQQIRERAAMAAKRLSSRRALIYGYTLKKHYELKYSDIADDVFSRIRERVDASIGTFVPNSVQKLAAIYENLRSENPEDWSNAVHSCRRLLQDLADALFPPQPDRVIVVDGKEKTIKFGKDSYINRLVAYVEDRSGSSRFQDIVGSQLAFLGDRLDSLFRAAQKGSHDVIVSREEADRYVVYTYLIAGDILSLVTRSEATQSDSTLNSDMEKRVPSN